MSGGEFNYAYIRVQTFADDLEVRIEREANSPSEPEQWPELEKRLRAAVISARNTATMMRDIEWLFSGDNGSETTLRLSTKWPA